MGLNEPDGPYGLNRLGSDLVEPTNSGGVEDGGVADDRGLTLGWKVILGSNLALGLVLWVGMWTDFAWSSFWANVIYPLVVGALGCLCCYWGSAGLSLRAYTLRTYACLLSIVGGVLYALAIGILLVPPFTLGTLFMIAEESEAVTIQVIRSPSGWKTAEVVFKPVGAYSSGNGRISVRVRYAGLPFIHREVYSLGKSYADKNTRDYAVWKDDNTLFMSEMEDTVKVGWVKGELPLLIQIPIGLIGKS